MTDPEESIDDDAHETNESQLPAADEAGSGVTFDADLLRQLGPLGAGVAERLAELKELAGSSTDAGGLASLGTSSTVESPAAVALEELADDMLVVRRQLREVETGQQALAARLDALQELWSQASRGISREIDGLRRELVGDRKMTAIGDLLGEVLPLTERLKIMRANLHAKKDARMIAQLDGVIESLTACLRRVGCEEIRAVVGGPFDAERMQCVSFAASGDPGVVLEEVQPGYACGQTVLRRASVVLAKR